MHNPLNCYSALTHEKRLHCRLRNQYNRYKLLRAYEITMLVLVVFLALLDIFVPLFLVTCQAC